MVQPPAQDAFEALDWIVSRHVHEYLDVAGRPVGEGRAAAFQQVPTEMQSCPYAGSRYHHAKPMNLTALQRMPDWPQVLTILSWLSQRHRTAHKTEVATYDDLAQVTGAGVFLADFLVLRRHHSLRSHEIPLLISGLYKVCLGFQLAYLPERYSGETTGILPDPAGFYAYLEENELLIGEAEVCAGSPAMITQAYDAITGRHSVAEQALPAACADLEIDWEQFDVFADHAGEMWRELVLFAMQAPQFLPELADELLPPDVQQRLNTCLERRGTELLAGQSGLVVEIARAAQAYGADPPLLTPEPGADPGSLGADVLAWLHRVAAPEMRTHAPVVAQALQAQLAAYDSYEASVMAGVNEHLHWILRALGLDASSAPLTPSALSHVCGRTLRDWSDPSW